ncbi:MAG TPA: hypothetical protein VHV10_06570 [Ktedonobacteraceae bacterium]|nr:hypothetical protein [Ktedonobacteraceae bacterium]
MNKRKVPDTQNANGKKEEESTPKRSLSTEKQKAANSANYSLQPLSETPPLSETNQFPGLNFILLASDFLYSFNIHSNA